MQLMLEKWSELGFPDYSWKYYLFVYLLVCLFSCLSLTIWSIYRASITILSL